jgi:hypothetical protein
VIFRSDPSKELGQVPENFSCINPSGIAGVEDILIGDPYFTIGNADQS